MQLLYATVCSVFAAFFVWLVVRLINRREQWAKRAAVGMPFAFVLYFLSFGPACGLYWNGWIELKVIHTLYSPMFWIQTEGPPWARAALRWYAGFGAKEERFNSYTPGDVFDAGILLVGIGALVVYLYPRQAGRP